mgnify:CR=1 FL=1
MDYSHTENSTRSAETETATRKRSQQWFFFIFSVIFTPLVSWLTLVIHDWAATKFTDPELPKAGPIEHIDAQERIVAAGLVPYALTSTREEKIFFARIRGDFEGKNFEYLEELLDGLLDSQSPNTRFSSDTWKVYTYFQALRHRFSNEDPWFRQNIDLAREWMDAFPDSIAARIAYSQSLLDYSLSLSREKFASKQYVAKASNVIVPLLVDARSRGLANPHMILLAFQIQRSQGKSMQSKESMALLDLLDEDYPNYHHVHQYVAKRLRWEKTKALSWEEFAENIYYKNSEGPLNYLHIVNAQRGGYGNIFRDSSASWTYVQNGLGQAEGLYPDSYLWLSYRTYYAVLARDQDLAKKCFDTLKGRYVEEVWRKPERFAHCLTWAQTGMW